MRSPALAIAWEFRLRHRWGLVALAGYLLVVGTIKFLVLEPGQTITLDPPDGKASLVIMPLSMTFFYFVAVFSFGLAGDLAGRQSIYPARMFALPVTTAALAGWPMLYGTAAMASLWLTAALVGRWLGGLDLPFIWPALLGAALLAWTQALTWMPYGLPGLRVIVTVLCLIALDAVVILAIEYRVSESVLVAFLAPQLPLAYLTACFALARARRGDVPDWRGLFARLGQTADVVPRRRDVFASAAHAQLWFEWRRHGRALPVLVALLLPFELALLFVPGNDTPPVIFPTLLAVLLTPPVMAGFAAATVSQANPHARDSYGVAPFMAARPLTSTALVAAKLKMAVGSTLAAWLLVAAAIPLALILSDTWPIVIARARQGAEAVGTPRAVAIAALALAGLLVSTWTLLVQNLYIGLTGREWLVKSSVFLTLVLLIILGILAEWIISDRDVQAALWDTWPWILTILVGLKMSAAAWIATRLFRSRLVGDGALVIGAACWLAAVLALYGVLVWLVATPIMPRYVLALVAILAVPLARVAAAPLALAWNRHR